MYDRADDGSDGTTPSPDGAVLPSSITGFGMTMGISYSNFEAVVAKTALDECQAGSFSFDGYDPCEDAPIGTYVDTSGAKVPTACEPGFTTATTASDSPDDCIPIDTDGDGVPDEVDLCSDTQADPAPERLKKNRNWPDPTETFGCSPSQIIDDAGLGKGHAKFGISNSALAEWIESVL